MASERLRIRENSLKVAATIKNAQDCYCVGLDLERNHGASFETENPQAGAQIIALVAAIRKYRKTATTVLDSVDIANRALRAVVQGDSRTDQSDRRGPRD
jgi:hypothetical protein